MVLVYNKGILTLYIYDIYTFQYMYFFQYIYIYIYIVFRFFALIGYYKKLRLILVLYSRPLPVLCCFFFFNFSWFFFFVPNAAPVYLALEIMVIKRTVVKWDQSIRMSLRSKLVISTDMVTPEDILGTYDSLLAGRHKPHLCPQ